MEDSSPTNDNASDATIIPREDFRESSESVINRRQTIVSSPLGGMELDCVNPMT